MFGDAAAGIPDALVVAGVVTWLCGWALSYLVGSMGAPARAPWWFAYFTVQTYELAGLMRILCVVGLLALELFVLRQARDEYLRGFYAAFVIYLLQVLVLSYGFVTILAAYWPSPKRRGRPAP